MLPDAFQLPLRSGLLHVKEIVACRGPPATSLRVQLTEYEFVDALLDRSRIRVSLSPAHPSGFYLACGFAKSGTQRK
jgi:hypothetical protein